MLLKQSKANI